MKDILYITLKVQAVYKMTWLEKPKKKKKFFLQLMVQPKPGKSDRFRRAWSGKAKSTIFYLIPLITKWLESETPLGATLQKSKSQ